jgi:hypothetical protein
MRLVENLDAATPFRNRAFMLGSRLRLLGRDVQATLKNALLYGKTTRGKRLHDDACFA